MSDSTCARRELRVRAAASLFGVVLTVGLLGCGGSESDPPADSRNESGSVAVTARIPVGGSPLDVVASDDAIWVSVSDTDALVRVDPQTNQVVATTTIAHPLSLAVGFDSVWVTSSVGVTRVNTTSADIETEIRVPFADDLAVGAGSVWVTGASRDGVVRINPATNTIVAAYRYELRGKDEIGDDDAIDDVVFSDDSLWVTTTSGLILRASATTGEELARFDVEGPLADIAVIDGAVWASNPVTEIVNRVEVASGVVETIDFGEVIGPIEAHGEALWGVVSGGVARISAEDALVDLRVEVSEEFPVAFDAFGDSLWITDAGPGGGLVRVKGSMG